MSREHYISRSVLNYGQPDKQNIHLSGPGGKLKPTGANALASARILCKKHNEQLSQVDAEMLRLVDAVFKWNNDGHCGKESFDAALISRWLMKFAAGSLAKGMVHGKPPSYMFQEPWLRILFGSSEIPDWCGFDVSNPSEAFLPEIIKGGVPPYYVALRLSPDEEAKGALIGIYPIELTMFFENGISYQGRSFRPTIVNLFCQESGATLTNHFEWPGENTIEKVMSLRCS